MPAIATAKPCLQIAPIAFLVSLLATTVTADARTYRVRVHPGLDQSPAASKATVVAQNSNTAAASQAQGSDSPAGRVDRPEQPAPSSRSDAGDPPSEKAAAAAARAKRALADEDGDRFEGDSPTQTELIPAEEPVKADGQPVTDAQRRRASAELQSPTQSASDKSSVTCIAGCK